MKDSPIIVLTTDFSEEAERAYQPAVDLADRLGGSIEVVHVVEELLAIPYGAPFAPPIDVGVPNQAALEQAAREHMAAAVQKLGQRVPVEGHVLSGQHVARAACDHAEKVGADFMVVSTHGRTGLRRMIMGSVAEQLLRQSVTPMLVLPRAA